jgi:hypothetical protein
MRTTLSSTSKDRSPSPAHQHSQRQHISDQTAHHASAHSQRHAVEVLYNAVVASA